MVQPEPLSNTTFFVGFGTLGQKGTIQSTAKKRGGPRWLGQVRPTKTH